MGLGALAWLVCALLWLSGADVSRFVALLAGFLVLVIVGERLELTRAVVRSDGVRRLLIVQLALLHASLLLRLAGGDLAGNISLWRAGGIINALAILLFFAASGLAVLAGRRSARQVDRAARQTREAPAGRWHQL